jgi:excisionase family DNA binding protein
MAVVEFEEQLFSKELSAVFLNLSVSSIDKLVREGALKPVRMGRSVKFERSTLEEYKLRCKNNAGAN